MVYNHKEYIHFNSPSIKVQEFPLFSAPSVDFRIKIQELHGSRFIASIELIGYIRDIISGNTFCTNFNLYDPFRGMETTTLGIDPNNLWDYENYVRHVVWEFLHHEFEEFLLYNGQRIWNPHSNEGFDPASNGIMRFDPVLFTFHPYSPISMDIFEIYKFSNMYRVRLADTKFEFSIYDNNLPLIDKFNYTKNVLQNFWIKYHHEHWVWPNIEEIIKNFS